MDYERIGLAVAEMLDVGYTHEWIAYLMEVYGVPKEYERPRLGESKYLFCKALFGELQKDEATKDIVVDIARYIVESERFAPRFEVEAFKHLPIFKSMVRKAGLTVPPDTSMKVDPIFHSRTFGADKKMCFVLMPFTSEWSDRIYYKVLVPILKGCGLIPARADDLFGHNVMEDIWSAINAAYIVIADVTGRNPNVFYELGIAHTLGKNVILLTQADDDVPFDIKQLRYIKYADNKDGYEVLENILPKYVEKYYSKWFYLRIYG